MINGDRLTSKGFFLCLMGKLSINLIYNGQYLVDNVVHPIMNQKSYNEPIITHQLGFSHQIGI